jgi:hypothetical protein
MSDDSETRGNSPEASDQEPPVAANPSDDVPETGRSGLAPAAMMALPPESRKLVNWLARRRIATFDELKEASGGEEQALGELLQELMDMGFVAQRDVEGVACYHVLFRGSMRRGPRRLGKELWNRLDFDDE